MLTENQIYLASRSPRRRELLRQIGVKFNLLMMRETLGRAIDIDEQPLADEAPSDYIYRVARAKANAGWKRIMQRHLPVLPVLVADTIVTIDGCILGKPRDSAHAEEMLKILSGRSHKVLTAVGDVLSLQFEAEWDIVVSNIISATLINLAPDAAYALRPGGKWIVSGIITQNWEDVKKAAEKQGLSYIEHVEEDGWVAGVFSS